MSINELAHMIMDIAAKPLSLKHIPGPLGVRGRNSDNELIGKMLGWKPSRPLREGLEITYRWIEAQVSLAEGRNAAQSSRIAGKPVSRSQDTRLFTNRTNRNRALSFAGR